MNHIARHFSSVVITANSTAATTAGSIAFGTFAGGVVMIANTGGATRINWHGTVDPAVAPTQIYADGSAVTSALTVGCVTIPDGCFALPYVVPIITGGTTCAMTAVLKG